MSQLFNEIENSNVYKIAIKTPLQPAEKLSKRLNTQVYLKREDLQPVHSFKIRGAFNKISRLTLSQRKKGIIAASAGNHAQGVALSAQRLKISALIVMPKTTPSIKIDAVKSYGSEVILYGDSFSEAAEHCKHLVDSTGRVFIHPYDDLQVIAGQGTVGKEILEQLPTVTHIFIPVGGGGLISGIATYVKQINPAVKIIGVEPEDAACLHKALKSDRRVVLPHVGIFADGVAVKQIGEHTFKIARELVDHTITVSNDQVCASIKNIYEETRSIVEPAGALGLAGLIKYSEDVGLKKTDKSVVINSGANMSFEKLQFISERTLIGSKRESLFSVTLPEVPGALERFCKALKQHSISEFNYRQANGNVAHILVGVLIEDISDSKRLQKRLDDNGFKVLNLTENELAKEHIRHMVGGKTGPGNEILVHFDFPERPGALSDFLSVLGKRWNISLFHYRGTGSDNGRVLIGFDVSQNDHKEFRCFLDDVGYYFEVVSKNLAYQIFLAK